MLGFLKENKLWLTKTLHVKKGRNNYDLTRVFLLHLAVN